MRSEEALRDHVLAHDTIDDAIAGLERLMSSMPTLFLGGGDRMATADAVQILKSWRPRPLPDAEFIDVYHGTDEETAHRMAREGVIPQLKPRNLARERFEAGRYAEFAPGRGVSGGIYVAGTPRAVEGYGRSIVRLTVPRHWLKVSPEQAALGVTDPMESLRTVDGAVVLDALPPEAVELMMEQNPKIVSLDPILQAAAGLVPNTPGRDALDQAAWMAPFLLESLGFEPGDSLKPYEIGAGAFARAYESPSGKVLKLTIDADDAALAAAVKEAGDVRGLVRIYDVYRMPEGIPVSVAGFRPRSRELYAIVAEKVTPILQAEQSVLDEMDGQIITAMSYDKEWARNNARNKQHFYEEVEKSASFRRPLSDEGRKYLGDLVNGFWWAHEHGFGIRDIHVGNIGITKDDEAVFIDFGQSAGVRDRDVHLPIAENPLTKNLAGNLDSVFDESFDQIEALFPDFGTCEFYEDEKAGADNGAGADRQFAYCKDGNPISIAFAPKAVSLPRPQLIGLMRHEFGHALEYRYGVKELERRLGRRLPEKVERRADAIAEAVWGEPITYDERLVQCVGDRCACGAPPRKRPSHLPDEKAVLRPNPFRDGY